MKLATLEPRTRARARQSGVTLVEVLIVVALIALLSGTVMFGSGMLGSSQLKNAATLIISAARSAQTRASATGMPVRLVFDLDSGHLEMQESQSRVAVRLKNPEDLTDEALREQLSQQSVEASRALEGDSEGAPPSPFVLSPAFTKDTATEGEPGGKALGSKVRIRQIELGRDQEARTSGKVALYFWPGGETERANIQLDREGSESGLTIVLSALTGRAKVMPGFVALERAALGEDFSEREAE